MDERKIGLKVSKIVPFLTKNWLTLIKMNNIDYKTMYPYKDMNQELQN